MRKSLSRSVELPRRLRLTPEHAVIAIPNDPTQCAVALAMRARFDEHELLNISVRHDSIDLEFVDGSAAVAYLSGEDVAWIRAFDTGKREPRHTFLIKMWQTYSRQAWERLDAKAKPLRQKNRNLCDIGKHEARERNSTGSA